MSSSSPSVVVSEFGKRLRGLTVEKSAINSLSILADEHRQYATDIVQIICDSIRQSNSGDSRLPLFYLIDSIVQHFSRNGSEYPKLFHPHLLPMFKGTVKYCSIKVKGSLYRMWNMWKTKRVFHDDVIMGLEEIFNAALTPAERTEALNRASGVPASADPRMKRPAEMGSSVTAPFPEQPAAKRMVINDPRRRDAPSMPSAPGAPVIDNSASLAELNKALAQLDIPANAALQPLIAEIRWRLVQPQSPQQLSTTITESSNRLFDAYRQMNSAPPSHLPLPPPHAHAHPQPVVNNPFAPPPSSFLPPPPVPAPAPSALPLGLTMTPAALAAAVAALTKPKQPPPPAATAAAPPAEDNEDADDTPKWTRQQLAQVVTFSDKDLRTPHPWLADTLYNLIPFRCKTCGRRINNQAEMTAHLDWHFKMNKRAALIEKNSSGVQSQNYYWEEWEWIQADDVIFGVQTRTPGVNSTTTTSSSSSAASDLLKFEEMEKKGPHQVVADDEQKKCLLCGEAFKTEWSDEEESWMYKDSIQITSDMILDIQSSLANLESAKPAAGEDSHEPGSAQAIAFAAKEEERQNQLHRYYKILQHMQTYQDKILHSACHFGFIKTTLKTNMVSKATPAEQMPALE